MVQERWSGQDDDDWVPKAVEAGCVVVTVDRNMLSHVKVIESVTTLGGRMVVFANFFANIAVFDQLAFLMRYWERIVERVEASQPGQAVFVYKDGRTRTGAPSDFAHKRKHVSQGAGARSAPDKPTATVQASFELDGS